MYDIGLIYRSNHNYGANLTHYALATLMEDMGKTVLMIDMPKGLDLSLPLDRVDSCELFAKAPYKKIEIEEECSVAEELKGIATWMPNYIWELSQANSYCDTFVVGSDQLWRDYFLKGSGYYTLLGWVRDDKRMISYATSFGKDYYEGNGEDLAILENGLSRFNRRSVREKSGQNIVCGELKLDCDWVLDPVFLCKKNRYKELLLRSDICRETEKIAGFYFLDLSKKKIEYLNELAREKRIKVLGFSDAMVDCPKEILAYLPINRKVEDWLALIQKSYFLVTDSFHGTCFAIILHKPFVVVMNEQSHRGYSRIYDLLSQLGLVDQIIDEGDLKKLKKEIFFNINYTVVDEKLQRMRCESMEWLRNALQCQTVSRKHRDFAEQWKFKMLSQKIDYTKRIEVIKSFVESRFIDGNGSVVLWGTGGKFKELAWLFLDACDVKYVIDSDVQKQGKRYCGRLSCHAPEKLVTENKNSLVVILVENPNVVSAIENQLGGYGIINYVTYREIVALF